MSFTRILWKEFRSQGGLCGVLMLGIVLTQFLVTMNGLRYPLQMTQEYLDSTLFVAVLACLSYGFISSAILFAAEREEETALFLLPLPVPRWSLLAGKLSFTLLSLLVLLTVGAVSSFAFGTTFSSTPYLWRFQLGLVGRSLIGSVAWGLLFSLLLNRVFPAIACAVLAEFTTVGLTGRLLFLDAHKDFAYLLTTLAVLVVDLWLAARWTSSSPPTLPRLPAWRLGSTSPAVSLWLLQRLESIASPQARISAVLTWKELRCAIPFVLCFSAFGTALTLGGISWRWPAPFAPLIFLTPVACGLAAFGFDQGRQSYRFFADRGVSPGRIWGIKTLFWGGLGLVLTAAFVLLDEAATRRGSQDWRLGSLPTTSRMVGEIVRRFAAWPAADASLMEPSIFPSVHLVLATWALLFASGLWCGLGTRRVLLAAPIAVGLGLLAIAWHVVIAAVRIPLSLGSWPLTVTALGAAWWWTPYWILDDRSWSSWRRRTAGLLGAGLLFVLAGRSYRIYEVPVVQERWQLWNEAKSFVESRKPLPPDLPEALREALRSESPDDKLRWALTQLQARQRNWTTPEELDAGWEGIRQLLLAFELRVGDVDDLESYFEVLDRRSEVLQLARRWAAAKNQSAIRLDRALADLEATPELLGAHPVVLNRYLRWRHMSREFPASFDRDEAPWLVSSLWCLQQVTGEFARADRLIETVSYLDLLQVIIDSLDRPFLTEPAYADQEPLLQPLLKRTILPRSFQNSPALIAQASERVATQIRAHGADLRGTRLCLRLQRYRLQTGHFPDSLDDVRDEGKELPLDPFSGKDFVYHKEGLDAPVSRGAEYYEDPGEVRIEIPARQPIVTSVGPRDIRLSPMEKGGRRFYKTSLWRPVHDPTWRGRGDLKIPTNPDDVHFVILW